jgi:hypothetical protein
VISGRYPQSINDFLNKKGGSASEKTEGLRYGGHSIFSNALPSHFAL